jgi:hypothetical protein
MEALMKAASRIFGFAVGGTLILGIPVASLLTEAPHEPLGTGVARPSNIDLFYKRWEARYVSNGGDRKAVVGVAYVEGLSQEFTRAVGQIDLDLERGTVQAEVRGLPMAADVWLIDNEEGKSVAPEPGDRMVRLGRLEAKGEGLVASADLGEDFFRNFELDLVVVTRAGKSPVESRVLVGSRSLFERLHTRTRLAALKEREEHSAGLGAVARLAELFSPRSADANQVLVARGLVSSLVNDGAELFFRGTFGGNGRTCGTCHRVEDNQGLEANFIATLPASDRLFIAEFPINQGGVPGLERPALMRNFGLILENTDGFDNPTVKFTMRGVPHSLSLATSILAPSDGRAPVQRTGWSADGAPGSGALRLFPVGAVTQHFTKRLDRVAGVDFVLPTDSQLDKMEAFMLSSGRLNELNLTSGVTLADPGAEAGRQIFLNQGKCNGCHGNAGAIASFAPGNRNFNTGTERLTNPARAVESFPFDGGFGTLNFDSNGDGVNDSFGDGTFNTPPLIEAADTAPFFHNNIAATIEDAVAFYSSPTFNNSPAAGPIGGISLTAGENSQVGDFLRVINAAFNVAIAIQRVNAAGTLENDNMFQPQAQAAPIDEGGFAEVDGKKETVDTLLQLANIEIADALDVLNAKSLHPSAATLLSEAASANTQAMSESSGLTRIRKINSAAQKLADAKAQFGTGLNFTLGEGNLVF